MRRALKDKLKHCFFLLYKLGIRLGVHVLPVHYYSSEPNIIELGKTLEPWSKPSLLPGIHVDLDEQVANLKEICLPFQEEYRGNAAYHQAVQTQCGPGYGYIEAQALHGVVRHFRPARIIEIGSGVSTFCAHQAVARNQTDCAITCIEPYPSPKLCQLRDEAANVRLIPRPVQDLPPSFFAELSRNDILFVDSSHVLKAGSDVNYLVLEVLPRLNPGVLVHFHDIYFPYDYQRDLLQTFLHNNETPFLRAFLTFNDRFHILFCLSHLHYERGEELKQVFPDYQPQSGWRGLQDRDFDPAKHFPSSLWLRVSDKPGERGV